MKNFTEPVSYQIKHFTDEDRSHIYTFRKAMLRKITMASREIVESFVTGFFCLEKLLEFIIGPEYLLWLEESPKDQPS